MNIHDTVRALGQHVQRAADAVVRDRDGARASHDAMACAWFYLCEHTGDVDGARRVFAGTRKGFPALPRTGGAS